MRMEKKTIEDQKLRLFPLINGMSAWSTESLTREMDTFSTFWAGIEWWRPRKVLRLRIPFHRSLRFKENLATLKTCEFNHRLPLPLDFRPPYVFNLFLLDL